MKNIEKVKLSEKPHASTPIEFIEFMKLWEEGGVEVRFKLKTALESRGLTVRECAELTGLRIGTISDIANGKKTAVSFLHIAVLMIVLGITDIKDIIEFYIPDNLESKLTEMKYSWISTQTIPTMAKCSGNLLNSKGNKEANVNEILNFIQS